jgi:hypothetical protein
VTSSPRAAWIEAAVLVVFVAEGVGGCRSRLQETRPSIQFTKVPAADRGGPDTLDVIRGRATQAQPGQRIVLFSRSTVWWVQPGLEQPFTTIDARGGWSASTHLGTEYAALLVDESYRPPATYENLPPEGTGVIVVAKVPGDPTARAPHHTLQFGGYEWRVRAAPSGRGGHNEYDPSNAWTDERGALHLRIAGNTGHWSCAEVSLTQRLGYGQYRFVLRDVSELEPAAVFGIFTWDGPAADQNHREMEVEISRWGDASSDKNAQYVVQPYYIGPNVARFTAPAGVLTHWLRWEPGRATFRTARGDVPMGGRGILVAEHVFTSGVPSSGNETVRMNHYVFQRSATPLRNASEVVIETFEYLP